MVKLLCNKYKLEKIGYIIFELILIKEIKSFIADTKPNL